MLLSVRTLFSPRGPSMSDRKNLNLQYSTSSSGGRKRLVEEEDEVEAEKAEKNREPKGDDNKEGKADRQNELREDGRISYLTVPKTPSVRRPSTADVVIEKLQVEKVEGGGLTISGISLAANCHFSLLIFGVFFIVAGIVLSYLGFSFKPELSQQERSTLASVAGTPPESLRKSSTHKQMKVIGPIFLVLGFLMLFLGAILYSISRKISRDEKEARLLNSAMQLCQLENSFNQAKSANSSSPVHTITAPQNQNYPVLSIRRGSWWMEPTPVEYPPQIPPDGEYLPPSYNRRGSQSSSPLMDNSGLSWPQPQPENNLQHSPLPHLHQQSSHQQHQQPPQIVNARLSSPLITYFYGTKEGSTDIATFPLENFTSTSYQVNVQSVTENSNPKCDLLSSDNEIQSSDKSGEGNDGRFDASFSPNSGEQQSDYLQVAVPVITVSSIPHIQVTSASASVSKEDANEYSGPTTYQPLSTNLPLSRNGVAIPRMSRHS